MSTPVYCRRESCKTPGGARITKANALNWCSDCRASLPFWPTNADESRAAVVPVLRTVIEDAVLLEVVV
jgi:hypothetical protein